MDDSPLIPGQEYRFELENPFPFAYSDNPVFGSNQALLQGFQHQIINPIYRLDGFFITDIKGCYAFYVPISRDDKRIVFIPAKAERIKRRLNDTWAKPLITMMATFLHSPYMTEIYPDSDLKITIDKLINSVTKMTIHPELTKKVATRKLKPFMSHVFSKPPTTVVSSTGNEIAFSGGPYYKRAMASFNASRHNGAAAAAESRTRKMRRTRKTRRSRK